MLSLLHDWESLVSWWKEVNLSLSGSELGSKNLRNKNKMGIAIGNGLQVASQREEFTWKKVLYHIVPKD